MEELRIVTRIELDYRRNQSLEYTFERNSYNPKDTVKYHHVVKSTHIIIFGTITDSKYSILQNTFKSVH